METKLEVNLSGLILLMTRAAKNRRLCLNAPVPLQNEGKCYVVEEYQGVETACVLGFRFELDMENDQWLFEFFPGDTKPSKSIGGERHPFAIARFHGHCREEYLMKEMLAWFEKTLEENTTTESATALFLRMKRMESRIHTLESRLTECQEVRKREQEASELKLQLCELQNERFRDKLRELENYLDSTPQDSREKSESLPHRKRNRSQSPPKNRARRNRAEVALAKQDKTRNPSLYCSNTTCLNLRDESGSFKTCERCRTSVKKSMARRANKKR